MNNKNLYLSIIIVILVGFGIFLLKPFLIKFLPASETTGKVILSLSSENNEYQVNEPVVVDVYLESAENFDGVDVLIKYDNKYLFVGENLATDKQTLFKSFFGPDIDEEKGEIKFSALLENGTKFQGKAKITSLNFFARQKGRTMIEFVFEQGRTTDSNVSSFDKHRDILDKVENLSILIK